MDDIEFQVRTFVSEFCLEPVEKCSPGTRINHDLGIAGDDAVELFEAFAIKFGADLTDLYNDWSIYFRSEYTEANDLRKTGTFMILFLLFLALGFAVGLDGWSLFFFSLPGGLLGIIASNYFRPFGKGKKRALPISAMVEAARLGHWPQPGDDTTKG